MSSAISPMQSTDDGGGLDRAVAQVAEDCFYAMVEPAPTDAWLEGCAAHDDWMQADVVYSGTFAGVVSCRLPRVMARDLAAAFLGMAEEDLDPAADTVRDLAGELANMVCGRWLTATQPTGLFDLAHPIVISAERPDATWHGVLVNGFPLALRVATHG
jgi:CheY-specific phosphatase CheX